MIYSIYMDDVRIYDEEGELSLLDGQLNIELNSAGSLEFNMPADHLYYDLPKPLVSNVEVRENDDIIWFGRITEIETDFNNTKRVFCEGALAYFNDSIQRPKVYDDGDQSIKTFFRDLIEAHNSQVPSNRQFLVGEVNISENFIYRKLNYETTMECLNKMCLEAEGGYLFLRKEGEFNYIDWLREVPYYGDQPLEFGVNLTELKQTYDYSELATSIIPIGAEDEDTKIKATCADANGGFDYIDSKELIDIYGRITKVVEFGNLTLADDLLESGQKYLTDNQFDPITIEVSAAELAYLNDNYTAFKTGQMVRITSTPHLLDKEFPILKMTLNLDTATKTITCGNVKKKTLTEIYKE